MAFFIFVNHATNLAQARLNVNTFYAYKIVVDNNCIDIKSHYLILVYFLYYLFITTLNFIKNPLFINNGLCYCRVFNNNT